MPDIRLDLQAIEMIAMCERMTKVPATDFVETGQIIYFVVPSGSMRKMSGNQGIERLSKRLGKTVRMVETSEEPEGFLRNLFWHYGVEEVSIQEGPDGLHARVSVSPLRKGRAIGKGGENLNALRELARRHVGVANLVLT